MVVDGLQNMLVIRAHALNVVKWVIGRGNVQITLFYLLNVVTTTLKVLSLIAFNESILLILQDYPFLETIMVHRATPLETSDTIIPRRQLESIGDHPRLETIGSIRRLQLSIVKSTDGSLFRNETGLRLSHQPILLEGDIHLLLIIHTGGMRIRLLPLPFTIDMTEGLMNDIHHHMLQCPDRDPEPPLGCEKTSRDYLLVNTLNIGDDLLLLLDMLLSIPVSALNHQPKDTDVDPKALLPGLMIVIRVMATLPVVLAMLSPLRPTVLDGIMLLHATVENPLNLSIAIGDLDKRYIF